MNNADRMTYIRVARNYAQRHYPQMNLFYTSFMRLFILFFLISCSTGQYFQVIHPDIIYRDTRSIRGDALMRFTNYDLYIYPSPLQENFAVQLEIRNTSYKILTYELNDVTLKGPSPKKYRLMETNVYECPSGTPVYPTDRNIKIDPGDCFTVLYKFRTYNDYLTQLQFQDWGHIRPLTLKFRLLK